MVRNGCGAAGTEREFTLWCVGPPLLCACCCAALCRLDHVRSLPLSPLPSPPPPLSCCCAAESALGRRASGGARAKRVMGAVTAGADNDSSKQQRERHDTNTHERASASTTVPLSARSHAGAPPSVTLAPEPTDSGGWRTAHQPRWKQHRTAAHAPHSLDACVLNVHHAESSGALEREQHVVPLAPPLSDASPPAQRQPSMRRRWRRATSEILCAIMLTMMCSAVSAAPAIVRRCATDTRTQSRSTHACGECVRMRARRQHGESRLRSIVCVLTFLLLCGCVSLCVSIRSLDALVAPLLLVLLAPLQFCTEQGFSADRRSRAAHARDCWRWKREWNRRRSSRHQHQLLSGDGRQCFASLESLGLHGGFPSDVAACG